LKKIQSFYIFKIASSRLKECNFRINSLTIDEARINGEIISIADSQLVRTIHEVTESKYSPEKLKSVLDTKRYLSKKQSSQANKNKLVETNNEIDSLLFIPEILTVFMENKSHYEKILSQGGFFVNNVHFVPFMASSGQIRRNTAFFIDEKYKHVINDIFDNGRNKEKELVPAKFSAYFSLYSSSSLPVSTPRFAVVSDMTITAVKHIDWAEWVGENIDPIITEQDRELEFNAFDGCGMVSPEMASQWSYDLGLDYIGSTFGVRSSFLKGMCVAFDFHQFSKEVAKTNWITDIYGEKIDVKDIDVIVSPSMFKLSESYSSTKDYLDNCFKNEICIYEIIF